MSGHLLRAKPVVQPAGESPGRFVVRALVAQGGTWRCRANTNAGNRIPPSLHYEAKIGGYWEQAAAVRANKTRSIARWRMAVAAIVEPLTAVIILLILWGIIGRVSLALHVAVGLALAVVLLVSATLLGSICAVSMGRWQRGDGR